METIYTVTNSNLEISYKDTITIWFWGDVHRDTPSCDVERWKWFLSEAKRTMNENTYFYGLGDYNDFASASEQKHIHSGKLHRETILKLDDIVKRDNRRLASEIKFMRGKIIGLVEGNHTWEFFDGQTACMDLATRMGTNYLGWLNHHTINISFKDRAGSKKDVYIIGCHGKAGGKTMGNTINQVDDMRSIFPIADIYVMGHDHQRTARPASILLPYSSKGESHLKQKRQFLCRSGSFKKAYTPGVSSYEVSRLLKPSDLGALRMDISFHRDTKEGERIITDITAIV
jgi:hypothetical protein